MTNEESGVGKIETSESFDFIYCGCFTLSGCGDYSIRVTALEIIERANVLSLAIVSNVRIAALSQEFIVS